MDFSPFTDYLFSILLAILGIVIPWIFKNLRDYLKSKTDINLSNELDRYAVNAVNVALERLYAKGGNYTKETENEVIKDAVNALMEFAPKILNKFGYSEKEIRAKVEAWLYDKDYDDDIVPNEVPTRTAGNL